MPEVTIELGLRVTAEVGLFVGLVWLPCFDGVARDYYGGLSYDVTWLVVI